jgi:uncharacterized protein YkwD
MPDCFVALVFCLAVNTATGSIFANSSLSEEAQALFASHNAERLKNGAEPFSCLSKQLSALALEHVMYEISIDDISHNGLSERCGAVGAQACGENTLYNYNGDTNEMTRQWMNSTVHRENILKGEYNQAGFGVQQASNGKWFATALFTKDSRACN